ncbi:MAG: bifunctional phosphoribosylaminoimidazolecarboxamide formyltransferase/IMP cyclohydrolase, partial [Candidatus Eiseniibacteriota bacterium]
NRLRAAGVPVRDVSEVTGYPELFDGRVKTLHPAVHGGILFRRGLEQDEEQRHKHGIVSIDLVAVNLYPFERTVADPGVSLAEAVEQIDIGGPSLIRAAAKNHPHVVVVVDPDQYSEVLLAMDSFGGVPLETARVFARRAFERTSTYDAAIARFLASREGPEAPATSAATGVPGAIAAAGGSGPDPGGALPPTIDLDFRLSRRLRYGENPGQEGAFYVPSAGRAVEGLNQRRGRELSYNNLLDVESALGLLREFSEPAAVVIKHRSPSGAAVATSLAEALTRARDGDTLSAFGGILGLNRPLDEAALEAMGNFFFEVVVAPAIVAAEERLTALRKNMVVLEVPDLARGAVGAWAARTLLGGLLVETLPGDPRFSEWKPVTQAQPTAAQIADLQFGWRVARHTVSNAIVIAKNGRTLGIGAGQSSRVDSVRLALLKAERSGHDVRGAALCSDAFFPFSDSVEIAAQAGIAAIAHPGGSVRDNESVAAADRAGIAMMQTGERCFLH